MARAKPYTTESEGCALVWHCWPAKQAGALPLLLVHGGFGAWTHWAANIEALSERFQVWTVDMPGLGDSGDLPDPVSVHHIAKLLWSGWRELQGGNAFELAGFSFGAMVAGRLAAVAGGGCRRCSLIGAVGFGQLQVQVDLLAPPAVGSEGAEAIHRENLGRLMIHDQALIDPLAVYIHSNNLGV